MKPTDVKSSSHFNFGSENNEKGPKYEVGDHVRISKYKPLRNRLPCKLV